MTSCSNKRKNNYYYKDMTRSLSGVSLWSHHSFLGFPTASTLTLGMHVSLQMKCDLGVYV